MTKYAKSISIECTGKGNMTLWSSSISVDAEFDHMKDDITKTDEFRNWYSKIEDTLLAKEVKIIRFYYMIGQVKVVPKLVIEQDEEKYD